MDSAPPSHKGAPVWSSPRTRRSKCHAVRTGSIISQRASTACDSNDGAGPRASAGHPSSTCERDYERLVQHSESLITWAAITLMTRRITRRSSRRSGQPASREAQRD